MRTLPFFSSVIILVLGAACLAVAAREERRLSLQDPQKRTTAATNYRQLRMFGAMLIFMSGSSLLYILLGQN